MPRKLPPFVTRERTRHGTLVFYFRRGKGPRTRLPAFGAEGFDEAYQAALAGVEPHEVARSSPGTLRWLIDRYRETAQYRALSPATRRQRDNIFSHVIDASGDEPYRAIARADILAGRQRRAHTPSQARNFLDAMRGVFRWALDAELVEVDPTANVKNPPRPKTGGFAVWTDDDIEAYEARWPLGTKERVWLAVLLNTGLRRGDAVAVGRQHIKDGLITLKTEKTGMTVYIPIFDDLMTAINAGPVGDLAFIVGELGKPLTKESFGNFFRAACNKAGVAKSAHGLRKLAASRAAEHGLSVAELEAMFGWTGGTMASFYTKAADRKRLAVLAGEKMGNAHRPHLKSGAGRN
jgi:integrase